MPTKTNSSSSHDLEDFRRIYSFAVSAGDTISDRDAIEIIKAIAGSRVKRSHMSADAPPALAAAIARSRMKPSRVASAVSRHLGRVRKIIAGGVSRGN